MIIISEPVLVDENIKKEMEEFVNEKHNDRFSSMKHFANYALKRTMKEIEGKGNSLQREGGTGEGGSRIVEHKLSLSREDKITIILSLIAIIWSIGLVVIFS